MRVYPGWWIVVTGMLALVVGTGATFYIFSVVAGPMEEELGWSRSLLYGAVSLSSVVASLVAGALGPLFDRYGARSMMAGGALAGGLALALVALAADPLQFYLLLGVVFGASRAVSSLGPRTAIANWFIRKRPQAYATYTIGGPLSGVVLVPPVAWLLTFAGWRAVWLLLGIVQLVVVLPLSWLVIRRRPEDVGLLPDGDAVTEREGQTENPLPGGEGRVRARVPPPLAPLPTHEHPEDRWTRGPALRTATFWLVAAGFACTQFAGSGLTIHLAPHALDRGLTAGGAAAVLTSYSVGAVLARLVWANVVGHIGVHRAMVAYASTYTVSIVAMLLAGGAVATFAAAFGVGLVAGGTLLLQGHVWPDYFGRNIVGALTGYATVIQLPSQAFAPLGAALAHDLTGSYLAVFSAFAALNFAAAVCFIMGSKPPPPASQSASS